MDVEKICAYLFTHHDKDIGQILRMFYNKRRAMHHFSDINAEIDFFYGDKSKSLDWEGYTILKITHTTFGFLDIYISSNAMGRWKNLDDDSEALALMIQLLRKYKLKRYLRNDKRTNC